MGALIPPAGLAHACAQVYVLDNPERMRCWQSLPWGQDLEHEVLALLSNVLQRDNPFVKWIGDAALMETVVPDLLSRLFWLLSFWLPSYFDGARVRIAKGPASDENLCHPKARSAAIQPAN